MASWVRRRNIQCKREQWIVPRVASTERRKHAWCSLPQKRRHITAGNDSKRPERFSPDPGRASPGETYETPPAHAQYGTSHADQPQRRLIRQTGFYVKANLLLTHFGNLKWTHPYCTARKKAFFKVREFATTLICSAMAAQSVPSEEEGIKVAPLS